jgi:hypothetical protein
MTLTLLLTLTHRHQVKEYFIILQKLSTLTFSVPTDNIQNFKKQIQKASFQTVLDIYLISV